MFEFTFGILLAMSLTMTILSAIELFSASGKGKFNRRK